MKIKSCIWYWLAAASGAASLLYGMGIDGSIQTRSYQDKQGSNRTKVEVLANNVSFCGPKAADKPAVRDFDQQTESYTSEAKASYSAPQEAQNFSQGSVDDFAEITDDGDLPF